MPGPSAETQFPKRYLVLVTRSLRDRAAASPPPTFPPPPNLGAHCPTPRQYVTSRTCANGCASACSAAKNSRRRPPPKPLPRPFNRRFTMTNRHLNRPPRVKPRTRKRTTLWRLSRKSTPLTASRLLPSPATPQPKPVLPCAAVAAAGADAAGAAMAARLRESHRASNHQLRKPSKKSRQELHQISLLFPSHNRPRRAPQKERSYSPSGCLDPARVPGSSGTISRRSRAIFYAPYYSTTPLSSAFRT